MPARNAKTSATGLSTRERLSVEAARLFAERGYHGTSINDLAVALGIQKSSLYAYISGKADLLADIALTGAAAFHAALDQLPDAADPGEKLELALRAHLSVVESQLDVATVWLQEWRYLTGEPRRAFIRERRRYERRVRDLFEAAVDSGELRADLDVDAAILIFLSVANWAYTWLTAGTDVTKLSAGLMSMLLRGMGPDGKAAVGRG
jgi:TetR/AcrR family transcriptional regulator, cholesterol catabolism regulator